MAAETARARSTLPTAPGTVRRRVASDVPRKRAPMTTPVATKPMMTKGRREAAVHKAGGVQQMPLAIIAPKQRAGRNAQAQQAAARAPLAARVTSTSGAVFVASGRQPARPARPAAVQREDGGHQGHQGEDPDALGQHDARQVGGDWWPPARPPRRTRPGSRRSAR